MPLQVLGISLDTQTRCYHYHSARDVIAIKFKCCNTYYACYACHEALAGHHAQKWARSEFNEHAILCGACHKELTIQDYLSCSSSCPHCGALFNPGCKSHWNLYFDFE